MGSALDHLLTIARAISMNGNPSAATGERIATTVLLFSVPLTLIAAIRKPRKRLPESPRKMLAGGKLKKRNPRTAPASAEVNIVDEDCPKKMLIAKSVTAAKRITPDASPSSPSIRF